ncbi:unnamed protein product [Owenia fusiformis]|uniref:Uncharacterized protein n=1 Tax=Owenia fusiformis TaxID=6347 RepID=A0A8J1UYP7_OWEFU|nr:unnamed protein product [Owenia fusiformis]
MVFTPNRFSRDARPPGLDPKAMPSKEKDKQGQKSTDPDLEAKELCRLLNLLNTPASKQQLPSLDFDLEGSGVKKSLQWPAPQPKGGAHQHQSTEALALEQFSLKYQSLRDFKCHSQDKYFSEIFSALVKQRLCNTEWNFRAPPENILRVLVCLRIMMRDNAYQKDFFDHGGLKVLTEHFHKATDSYLTYGDGPYVVDILKEMTNIFQKLSAVVPQRELLVACGAHKPLVLLLSSSDVIVLHCSLYALISLAQSDKPRSLIGELNSVEMLLRILQDYDILSKKLAANLLRTLCADDQVKEMVKVYDGVPILLSLLHSDNVKLLWNVVWCIVQLAEDQDTSNDIRQMGGIPIILSLLHDRKFVTDRSSTVTTGPASATVNGRTPAVTMTIEEDIWSMVKDCQKKGDELREHQLSLKSACCASLTELVLNDTNAQMIVQSNGVFSLAILILPAQSYNSEKDRKSVEMLQANAFRALRFLFSMERNRRLFKRLFPPSLFEMFIDIGHYIRDLSKYKRLVDKLNSLGEDAIEEIKERIVATNQNKEPNKYIGDYAIMELLGTGAFGSVYKVKKKNAGQTYMALKEIFATNPTFGKTTREKEKSIGEIISELTIIKEQLKHPNVVRYYKTFPQDDKLYILMELIEGAPIGEHFSSLKEKGEKFSEPRIWNIFIQMVLALRYLHKEKHIVHRDLTPNNIMLGENDKVTITDFGLAKQKQKDSSKMTSVVGTILYSCPEVVQSQPYGEKADVWAIGCILYQMCTLKPPFYSSNMLSLATKIVDAEYEPIPEGEYSERVIQTVKSCITADPQLRPDIVQVASQIADVMMSQMDTLRAHQLAMEKKLERERKRTQRHFNEANKVMQNYHRLFLASQERYDKLINLQSSGGASSIKDGDLSDNVFSDSESNLVEMRRRMPRLDELKDDQNNNDKGWMSDDEAGYSTSGSDSRESSAGSTHNILGMNLSSSIPRPPGPGTPRSGKSRRRLDMMSQLSQQLTLDIPNTNSAKSSRDSGFSSGDPSPNTLPSPGVLPTGSGALGLGTLDKSSDGKSGTFHKSSSMSSVEKRGSNSGKLRPVSATNNHATLTISPRKVRQISDPILQMLNILHKVIYITQLPPTLCHNPRRRVIERFKRALFAPQSTSFNLKNELKKLLIGSRELIDLNFGPSEAPILSRQASIEQEAISIKAEKPTVKSKYDHAHADSNLTYETMQNIIESVLVESGYYDMSPAARNKSLPLAPIPMERNPPIEPIFMRTISSGSSS